MLIIHYKIEMHLKLPLKDLIGLFLRYFALKV